MSFDNPIPIALLMGGPSQERAVSIASGNAVFGALQNNPRFRVRCICLDQAALPHDLQTDEIVFSVLHGEFGEDGRFQSLMDAAGMEYCGCDAASSELCMDKVRAKHRVAASGVNVIPGWTAAEWLSACNALQASDFADGLIAKPVNLGSSIGLTELQDFDQACRFAGSRGEHASEWLIERRIRGREFSVGILNDQVLEVVEIVIPSNGIYDYEQKYHRNNTRYECPARLSPQASRSIREAALTAFRSCGCRDYARVDFLMDQKGEMPLFLEINTLPGMTDTSLLPKCAAAVGMDFRTLIQEMIQPAAQRLSRRKSRQ
jgi:D-alanine-D-alanine ligase